MTCSGRNSQTGGSWMSASHVSAFEQHARGRATVCSTGVARSGGVPRRERPARGSLRRNFRWCSSPRPVVTTYAAINSLAIEPTTANPSPGCDRVRPGPLWLRAQRLDELLHGPRDRLHAQPRGVRQLFHLIGFIDEIVVNGRNAYSEQLAEGHYPAGTGPQAPDVVVTAPGQSPRRPATINRASWRARAAGGSGRRRRRFRAGCC
jgi:hypothetical protein